MNYPGLYKVLTNNNICAIINDELLTSFNLKSENNTCYYEFKHAKHSSCFGISIILSVNGDKYEILRAFDNNNLMRIAVSEKSLPLYLSIFEPYIRKQLIDEVLQDLS